MKFHLTIILAVVVTFADAAHGQPIKVVSPNIYAEIEAPTSSGRFGFRQSRALGIHSPSEFTALPSGGAVITALSFRPDATANVGDTGGFTGLTISLSITQVDPSNISSTYDDNITGTPVVVYDGPWVGTVENSDPPGPETRPFDFLFPLQTPYSYDPAEGNLLIDYIVETAPGQPTIAWDTDEQNVIADQQYIFGNFNSPDAGILNFNLITEFTFVPEPTAAFISTIALMGIFSIRRRPSLVCPGG